MHSIPYRNSIWDSKSTLPSSETCRLRMCPVLLTSKGLAQAHHYEDLIHVIFALYTSFLHPKRYLK